MRLRELAAEKAALAEKKHTQEFQERFLAIPGQDCAIRSLPSKWEPPSSGKMPIRARFACSTRPTRAHGAWGG